MTEDELMEEELRKGHETAHKVARRIAGLGLEDFADATDWEFLAGVIAIMTYLMSEVRPEALNLATETAKGLARHYEVPVEVKNNGQS